MKEKDSGRETGAYTQKSGVIRIELGRMEERRGRDKGGEDKPGIDGSIA